MPDSRLLTCSESVCIWNTADYIPVYKFSHSTAKTFKTVAWDTDDQFICVPTDEKKLVFSKLVQNDINNKEFDVGVKVSSVSCSNKSPYVAVGSTTGEVLCWDLQQEKITKTIAEMTSAVTSLSYVNEDSRVAVGCLNGHITVINTTSGFSSTSMKLDDSTYDVSSLHMHPKKHFLLGSAFGGGQVALWDLKQSTLYYSFPDCHKGPASEVKFSPLGNSMVASVGRDKHIHLYDIRSKRIVKNIRCEEPLWTLEFMPEGTSLIVGGSKGVVLTYDLKSSKILNQFVAHMGQVQKVAVSTARNTKVKKKHEAKPRKVLSPTSRMEPNAKTVRQSSTTSVGPDSLFSSPVFSSNSEGVCSTATDKTGLRKEVLKKCMFSSPLLPSLVLPAPLESPIELVSLDQLGEQTGARTAETVSSPIQLTFMSDNKENFCTPDATVHEEKMKPVGGGDESMEMEEDSPHIIAPTSEKQTQPAGDTISDTNGLAQTLSEMHRSLHEDIMNMHFQMMKQFVNMQIRLEGLEERCQINDELAKEVLHLREENKRLRTTY